MQQIELRLKWKPIHLKFKSIRMQAEIAQTKLMEKILREVSRLKIGNYQKNPSLLFIPILLCYLNLAGFAFTWR